MYQISPSPTATLKVLFPHLNSGTTSQNQVEFNKLNDTVQKILTIDKITLNKYVEKIETYSHNEQVHIYSLWDRLSCVNLNNIQKTELEDYIKNPMCFKGHYNRLDNLCLSSLIPNNTNTKGEAWMNKEIILRYKSFEEAILNKINNTLFKGLKDPQSVHQISVIRKYLDVHYNVYDGTYEDDIYNTYLNKDLSEKPLIKEFLHVAVSEVLKSRDTNGNLKFDFSEEGWASYLSKCAEEDDLCPDFLEFIGNMDLSIDENDKKELDNYNYHYTYKDFLVKQSKSQTGIDIASIIPQKDVFKEIVKKRLYSSPLLTVDTEFNFVQIFKDQTITTKFDDAQRREHFFRNTVSTPSILNAHGNDAIVIEELSKMSNSDEDFEKSAQFLHILLANSPSENVIKKIIELKILEKVDANTGKSIAHYIAETSSEIQMKCLIDILNKCPQLNLLNKLDNNGMSPLLIAAQNGNTEIVKLLLDAKKIDVN